MAGLSRLGSALALARRQGVSWLAKRTWIEVERASGMLERRFPCLPLSAFPDHGPVTLELPVRRDPAAMTAALRRVLGDAAGSVTAAADRVLAGDWPYFGASWLRAGFPPAWHRDPFSGWEPSASGHWTRTPLRGGPGDIKGVWEPSRFSPAQLLARAAILTGDDRYAAAFWSLLESWAEANPPGSGPNWACGQEATFRTIAWLIAASALDHFPATTGARRQLLSRLLFAHGRRILSNLGYARVQKNNHGVSEGVGLFTLGLLFAGQSEAEHWRELGLRVINEELTRQVYADGAYVQHSTNYARVALQDLLWALAVCRATGTGTEALGPALGAARRMSALLAAMQDPASGEAPVVGEDDGTLVLQLSSCRRRDFRPVLQAMAAAGEGERRYQPGPWDEEAVWLFGPGALELPLRPSHPESARDASDGGYYLRSRGALRAMLRAPVFRDRPAHADLLHLDLWWRGVNVVPDAGTGSYHAPPPWHRAFSTAAYHNAVTVDDVEPMRRGPGFTWLDWPAAPLVASWSAGAPVGACYLEARHRAYARLSDDIVVRRGVLVLDGERVVVVDCVDGRAAHRTRLRWLLCHFPRRPRPDGVTFDLPGGPFAVGTVGADAGGGRAAIAVTSEAPEPEAHRAASYRALEPAIVLSASLQGPLPHRFVTVFAAGSRSVQVEPGAVRWDDVTVTIPAAPAGPLIIQAGLCTSS